MVLAGCNLKGTGHSLIITQLHKNWLGIKQWRAVDSIKHCEKWIPTKVICSFWERVNFSLTFLSLRKKSDLTPFSGIWMDTIVQQRCFFFHVFPATLLTNWDHIFTIYFILCVDVNVCWDTPSENTGLWQIPNMSSSFNQSTLKDTVTTT